MNTREIIISISLVTGLLILSTPSIFAESWYVGKGLKQGDYFKYDALCYADYHDCNPLQLHFWVQNKTSDGNWNLQILVLDEGVLHRGTMIIGSNVPDPLNYSSNLSNYANVFKNTILWLDTIATKDSPKDFSDSTWGSSGFRCGTPVAPMNQENFIFYGNELPSWVIGWHGGIDNKIWVVPSLPFPAKAVVYNACLGSPYPVLIYNYQLWQTGNSHTLPEIFNLGSKEPVIPSVTNQSVPEFPAVAIMLLISASLLVIISIRSKLRF